MLIVILPWLYHSVFN